MLLRSYELKLIKIFDGHRSDPLLQRKIYLREFARGLAQPAMPTMPGQMPHNGGKSLEDLEEDDNLEELIGKNWDRPQQVLVSLTQ